MDETVEGEVVSDSLPASDEGELDIDLDVDDQVVDNIKQERQVEDEEEEEEEEEQEETAESRETLEKQAKEAAAAAASGHKGVTGYQCKLCTVLLSSQGALDEHMNIHTGSRPYKCRECNFSCSLHNTLVQHLAVHNHPRADMNSQQWLEQAPVYNNHTDRHAPEPHPPVPLPPRMPLPENHTPTLPFTAVEQALMPSGLPSFPDQGKVFQCKLCTHVSPTKTHLNEHMNVHTGKKPYKCLVCGFSSAFRSSLMRHLIVHTGTSKQFKCDSCHYQTPYKCNLQAHKRKRHNSNSLDSVDMNYPPITSQNQTPLDESPPLQSHGKLFSSEEQTRYLIQSELVNSAHTTHQSHENSGNRRHSLSPDDHDSSASNDTHESARINNSQVPLLKTSEISRYNSDGSVVPQSPEPPVLEKNSLVGEAEITDRPKSGEVLDYSSPSLANNVHDLMPNTCTSQSAISVLSNAVSSASSALGMSSVGTFPGSLASSIVTSIPSTSPQHPLSEISVITPLQWAGAGFPIYRRKKEGGARKRKRTPLPKRNYLISPNGEDLNNSWADTRPEISDYVRTSGESQARQYCHVTQAYSLKTEDTLPYAMKSRGMNGVDLSVPPRDVVYPDIEPVSNSSVSPISQAADDTQDERNLIPQGVAVLADPSQESLGFNQASRATQTDLPSVTGDSSGKLDGQSQTDQVGVDPSSIPSNLLKCPHCETFFTDHVIFTLHMSCHGSRHPFQCSICGYVCRDKIEFTCHITRSQHMR